MPERPQELRDIVDGIATHIVDTSRRIHAHPEVRFTERFAANLLTERLRTDGFDVEAGSAGLDTAFTATYGNSEAPSAPTIAVFCEYDALEGIGHGCGHNVIAAAGLGAALATKRWLQAHPQHPGRLAVFGSPAEEGGGGKTYLLDAGYLADVQAALMVHPAGEDRVRMQALARVALEVSFTGRPAHAAGAPEEGINALDAANLTMTAIGLLRQQLRPDSRVHGIVTDGGQAANIVPEHAALRLFVRSPDDGYLTDRLLPAVENCARGAALATGASVEISRPIPAYTNMSTNEVIGNLCGEAFTALGREAADPTPGAVLGSTDMGNVSRVVPSAHPCLRLRPGLAMHTREATAAAGGDEGDRAALDGALLLAHCLTRLYAEPELLAAAWAEHEGSGS